MQVFRILNPENEWSLLLDCKVIFQKIVEHHHQDPVIRYNVVIVALLSKDFFE